MISLNFGLTYSMAPLRSVMITVLALCSSARILPQLLFRLSSLLDFRINSLLLLERIPDQPGDPPIQCLARIRVPARPDHAGFGLRTIVSGRFTHWNKTAASDHQQ